MNKTITFILTIVVCFSLSCNKKRNNPFCSECEKGKLYYRYSGCSNIFIDEKGDTLLIKGYLSKRFQKDGIKVCLKYKDVGISSGGCAAQEVKCIRELK